MPGAALSRRCSYVEAGWRCRRVGFGNPPLCRSHYAALELALDGQDPLRGLLEAFDRYLARQPGLGAGLTAAVDWLRGDGPPPGSSAPPSAASASPRRWSGNGRTAPASHPFHPPPRAPEPPQAPGPDAREVMGFAPGARLTSDAVKRRRRELARIFHSDGGGNEESMRRVNVAADALLRELRGR